MCARSQDVCEDVWDSTLVWPKFPVVTWFSAFWRVSCTPTWCEEAVEVTDDGAKRWPERGLVVHAAGNQISQFGPLWGRKLVVVLVEQSFLCECNKSYWNWAAWVDSPHFGFYYEEKKKKRNVNKVLAAQLVAAIGPVIDCRQRSLKPVSNNVGNDNWSWNSLGLFGMLSVWYV